MGHSVDSLGYTKRFSLLSATEEFVRAKKLQVLLLMTKIFTSEKLLIYVGLVAPGATVRTWTYYYTRGCLKMLCPAAVFGN